MTHPKNPYAEYNEAALVLPVSPKASAALSRRCLQMLLVRQGAHPGKRLADQIDQLTGSLPAYLEPFVHHIRKLGNVAAHPQQDRTTAEVVDVEPDEAEWMLELLEQLLDHYYAKPAEADKRRAELDARLKNARNLT